MDMRYLEFSFANKHFYDVTDNIKSVNGSKNFQLPPDLDWTDWSRQKSNGWFYCMPKTEMIPEQGWKIHSSAVKQNAQKILHIVSEYCYEKKLAFKFLPSQNELMRTNLKYAPRGGSGKFITIYPSSDEECEYTLRQLNSLIGGELGPYILSDVRWDEGPLFFRYGGFQMKLTFDESNSEMVPAIRRPDGELEPDRREAAFTPPDWLELPEFVQEKIDALGSSDKPEDFPYSVIESLHFSNGGGIYKATRDGDNQTVVLKEGRPYAGLGPDGRDAVERLVLEHEFLTKLEDLDEVVNCYDLVELGGHRFLVEEFIEGNTINSEIVLRTPLIRAGSRTKDFLDYRNWALPILDQVEKVLESLHARKLVFGDLHPNNIILTSENKVKFIDFEMAYFADETDISPSGAPGFVAPDGRTGFAADRYSLGCMKIAFFVPLTVIMSLDRDVLPRLLEQMQKTFDLSDEFCRSIESDLDYLPYRDKESIHVRETRELIEKWEIGSDDSIRILEEAIFRGISESMDLARTDRIFPGDIRQFIENGFSLASGAAGNLIREVPGKDSSTRVLDWMEDVIFNSPPVQQVGFYNGLTGAAFVLRRLGRSGSADRLQEVLCGLSLKDLPSDLHSGLAGLGCYLVEEFLRSPNEVLRNKISEVAGELLQRKEYTPHADRDGARSVATNKGGLMFGGSGQALMWLRYYEAFGDEANLDRAQAALDFDLSTCVICDDGSLQINEGWRSLPYLASGSAGLALVLLRLLRFRKVPAYEEALEQIQLALTPSFTIQSGLFNGRAGFIYTLAEIADSAYATPNTFRLLDMHAAALRDHAVIHGTGIHFPGDQLLRLSTDLATGSAGIALALDRYAQVRHGRARPSSPGLILF